MIKFNVEKERNGKFRAIFEDFNGMSIIYRGSEKKCRDYIETQKRKVLNGGLIHASSTVFKEVV